MKGQVPIRTVRDLMAYLEVCNPDSVLHLVPDSEGESFPIAGVLDFPINKETWILIDEFEEISDSLEDEGQVTWSGNSSEHFVGPPQDWEGERPGDMGTISDITELPVCAIEKPDVVKVRGKLRSA